MTADRPESPEEPLRVLVAHNAYRQRGGEDSVVAAEAELLRRHGHTVIELFRHNDEIDTRGAVGKLSLAVDTLWSRRTHAEATRLIAEHRPQVVHVHNTLPLLSPSLHWACADAGVAVVQTLHNFRLACPQAMFLRDGKVCEDCLGRVPLAGIAHGCYRGSRVQTLVLAGSLMLHRGLGTWAHKVDRFIALSEFGRTKFIAAGLDAERLVVKPHFASGTARGPVAQREGFLFVGRLSMEKGIEVLADAWVKGVPGALRVVGEGEVAARLEGVPRLQLLGALPGTAVAGEMARARALVVPSICYETFGRVVVEAYAAGLPVIASRIGSLAELVDDGVTGLLFDAGDPHSLHQALCWAEANPARLEAMGRAARERHAVRFAPEGNHRQLMAIYGTAMARRALIASETSRRRDASRRAGSSTSA